MSNAISDPGHELNLVWEWFTGAERRATGDAHSGSYAAYLPARMGFSPQDGLMRQTGIAPDISAPQILRVWRRIDIVPAGATLYLDVDRGTGGWETIATFPAVSEALATWVQYESGELAVAGATWRVRARAVGDPAGFGVTAWLLDDWELIPVGSDEVAAKRRQIKDAIVTALAGLTVANGYTVDVGDVVDGDSSERNIDTLPAVRVRYIRQQNSYPNVKQGNTPFQAVYGGVIGQVGLVLDFVGKNGHSELDDMAADAEELLQEPQASGSPNLGLGFVLDVRMAQVGPVGQNPPEIARDRFMWQMQIDVDFRYDRRSP